MIDNSVEFYDGLDLFYKQTRDPKTNLPWSRPADMMQFAEERIAVQEEKSVKLAAEVAALEEQRLADLEALEIAAAESLAKAKMIAEADLAGEVSSDTE
jgi:hypothetical protein